MGLIQAVIGGFSSTVADMWKDYFVCDSLTNNILVAKAIKKGGNSLFGDSDVITNGSGIVVADGQCAIVVDDGQITEIAAEPGMYTFDSTKSPSVFDGGFAGIKDSFKEIVGRFTYGGIATKSQRVYFVNTKEITGNLFGTATPVPFRVVDPKIGLDLEASLRCNGEYSFRIVNPLIFYKAVAGNQADCYRRENLENTMRAELLNVLQPGFAKIAAMGVRYSEIPAHTLDLCDVLNEYLSARWGETRGINIVSIAFNSISLPKEDEELIKSLQRTAVMRDPSMMAANLASAQADALRDAANNSAGAGVGFMNLNMANNAGGSALSSALNAAAAASTNNVSSDSWTCSCGNVASGNFCNKCGSPKPAASGFCSNCGAPVSAGSTFCSKCGAKL